jgi:hypothetical protein
VFSRFKVLLICITAFALALVQVFGVQAGYLCGCTGQQSNAGQCETGDCHPGDCHEEAATKSATGDNCGQHDDTPGDHHHRHSELRGQFVVSGFPPVATLPPAVLVDVCPGFEVPDFYMLVTSAAPVVERTEPPEYGGPPMPLLVAETIVMLV